MYPLIEIARFCDDVPATTVFYETMLGQKADRVYEGMAEFDLPNGVTLRIHRTYKKEETTTLKDGSELPCEDHIAFAVPNLEQACEQAATNGLTCEVPQREYQWGKSAYFRDPDGRLVEYQEVS